MRGGCWGLLLLAVGLAACYGRPLQGYRTARGPSVVVRHGVETDDAPPAASSVAEDDRYETALASRDGGPRLHPKRSRSLESAAIAADRHVPGSDSSPAPPRTRLSARRSRDEEVRSTDAPSEEQAATTTGGATASAAARPPGSPHPPTPESAGGVRRRSAITPDVWLRVAFAALALLAFGFALRRWRARSRLRGRDFDGDRAWEVFQAQLSRRPVDGGEPGRARST